MLEDEGFIPTRGSTSTKSKIDYQCVAFQAHKSKTTERKLENQPVEEVPTNEINMKRARFEVIKFGMSGFDTQKKEEAKVQLAIKLGAKPRRNKYKNYKVLQTERKLEKEREITKLQFQQLGKNNIGKSNAKGKSYDRKRRKAQNILDIYGNVKASLNAESKKGKRS